MMSGLGFSSQQGILFLLFVGRSLYLGFVWVGWLASKKTQVSAYHKKRGVKIDKRDKKDKIIK